MCDNTFFFYREETYELKAQAFEKKSAALTRLGKQAIALANFGAEDKLELVEMTTKKLDDLTAQVSSLLCN